MKRIPAQSLLCPVLIGREAHLETMEQILAQARTGQSQTILLAGEAGWGKSRLTREFKSHATGQGWRCLQGDCFETERNLPYAPIAGILQILEQIPDNLTPLLSQSGSPDVNVWAILTKPCMGFLPLAESFSPRRLWNEILQNLNAPAFISLPFFEIFIGIVKT